MQSELRINVIQGQYELLLLHNIKVPAKDAIAVLALREKWASLRISAKTKDLRMKIVKKKFKAETEDKVADFASACKALKVEYVEDGPATDGVQLNKGLELLNAYREKTAVMRATQEDLLIAQRLFKIDLTLVP